MGDRSCQCLSDFSIRMQLLKSNWFCWSWDSKTSLWPSPLQKPSIPPKQRYQATHLQHFLCEARFKNSQILHTTLSELASRDGKGQVRFVLALLKQACPFPERAARPKILFPNQPQSLCFTSILGSCLPCLRSKQFLLFTLTFIPKTIQCAQQRYVRRTQHTK